MKTAGYIVLTYEFHREGRKWVAHCEQLGTATFGRSLTEAQERIEEAVECHLNTLEDVGECERFFRKHNIEFHCTKPRSEVNIHACADRDTFIQAHIQPVPVGAKV